jgi:hypothetical protein
MLYCDLSLHHCENRPHKRGKREMTARIASGYAVAMTTVDYGSITYKI